MGINDREKARLEQEIADLRRKQANTGEVDKTLDAALSKISDEIREYDDKYDEQVKRKKEALDKKKFNSTWDPKLTEALEIVRKPLQSYGENCEKAVAKLFKIIEKGLENGASEYNASRCVDAALSVLSDAENSMISFYQISKTLKYRPTYDGRSTKKSLEKIKKDLSSGAGTIDSQIKTREDKIRRIEKADKYGVALDQLDTHESYLAAVRNYEKATTGDQLRASAKELKALGSYLNSKIFFEECDKKVKAIEEVERAKKAVTDSKKALTDSEKTLRNIESEMVTSEAGLKKAQTELQTIEAKIDGKKATAISKYNKKSSENENLLVKLQGELSSLETQKREAETVLGKTFFLAFGKKKELTSFLESLGSQISAKESEIEQTKKQKQNYFDAQNSKLKSIDEKILSARKNVQDISSKLDSLRQHAEIARTTITTNQANLEKANQNYSSVISKQKQAENDLKEAELRKLEEERRQFETEYIAEEKRREEERRLLEEKKESSIALSMVSGTVTSKKPSNMDVKLEKLYERLEKWYPEHKAYAMDNVDKALRKDIVAYAKSHGKNLEQLLASIGFDIISGQEVYELRHTKLTNPGQEPAVFKDKIANILSGLVEYYPDKRIPRSVQSEHKALAGRISGAYQWLGYASTKEFLRAYGFDYLSAQLGRPTLRTDEVIAELKRKYPDGPVFTKLGELIAANPDLAGKLKTLSNSAQQKFGTTLKDYLYDQGLLSVCGNSGSSPVTIAELQERCEAFIQDIKIRYPDGSWFYSISSLISANDDLRVEQLNLKDAWREVYGKSLSDILKEGGIICDSDKAEKQWDKVIALIKQNNSKGKKASDISNLIKSIPDIDRTILNKLSKDAFGKAAKDKLSELGLLTIKLRGSMFKSSQERDDEVAAIEKAVATKKAKGEYFESVDGFANTNIGIKYDSYEKLNKKFLELFGMDAAEYLASNGVLLTTEKMIEKLLPGYDAIGAYPDLMRFLYAEGRKVSEIKADPTAKTSRDSRKYSIEKGSGLLRIAEKVGCLIYNISVKDLDKIPVGTKVNIVRDPHNPYSKTNIRVETEDGIRIGVLHKEIEEVLTPVLDLGITSVENGEIVVMDLNNRHSPVVVVAFDLITDKSVDLLTDTSEWYETKKVTLPKKSKDNNIKTEIQRRSNYLSYESAYGNAVFRGFRSQVDEAIAFIADVIGRGVKASKTKTPDIYEFYLRNTIVNDHTQDIVGQVLAKFPCLKMVAFYESNGNEGSVVFSKPGYDYVTDIRHAGYLYNHLFVWEEDPTQDFFDEDIDIHTDESICIVYEFPYQREWDCFDYLIPSEDEYSAVTSIKLPSTIIQLDDFAYLNSDYLEKITLPASIRKIGARAFVGCRNLARPEFEGEGTILKWIGKHLVSLETGELMIAWSTTDIPTDTIVKGIGSYVFMEMSAKEIAIPENISFIKDSAFKDCKNLQKITISGIIPEMTSAAFEGCKKIDTITIPNASIKDVEWSGMECALIKGFVELMQSGATSREEVVSGGNDYIKLHNNIVINNFHDNIAILAYVTSNRLLSPKAVDSILEKATKEKKIESTLLILTYKKNKQQKEGLDYMSLNDGGTEGFANENSLAGLTFVVTGDVNTFASRNDLNKYINERGGKLAGSVSSKTNYLITNTPNSGSTKNKTAQSLGVAIITEVQLREMAD